MNPKILAPQRTIGAITIKKLQGGEITLDTVITDIHNADESALYGYETQELRKYLEELKIQRSNIPIKNMAKRNPITKRIKAVANVLNSRKSIKPRMHIMHIEDATKLIEYEYDIQNLNESMIRRGFDSLYEIKKGDKMTDENNLYKKQVSVFEKDGELKNEDLLALYFSGDIGRINKGEFKPLSYGKVVYEKIAPSIRKMMELRIPLYVKIRREAIPISLLERRAFSLNDRSNKGIPENNFANEVSFLLNLKGKALRTQECSYYKPEDSKWIELKALSYNELDYEKNHIVVIAKPETLNHIENRCKKLHQEYYHFENKEGEIVHGLYGITKHEEKALKEIRKVKHGFDEEEIKELFDVLKDIDGRQNIRDIEYDIKAHPDGKYLLHKTSNELFFLKIALDDTPEYAKDVFTSDEYESFEIAYEYVKKIAHKAIKGEIRGITRNKITALRNVVSSLHLRYEAEEDLGKYLSEELDETDKVSKDRNFSFNKTHRNYYSQKEGVLAPYGNPQTTHRRRSNPPSLSSLRLIRQRNKFEVGGKYSGVSDPKILSKIYTGPKEETNFLKELMNFDKEYERVFGAKAPTPSTSFRAYPEYPIHDILGLEKEDKDIFLDVFSEVQGYLSKDKREFVRTAIFEALEEKYPAPKFKLQTVQKINYLGICNMCEQEGKCFSIKAKRLANKLETPKPLDWFRLGLKEGLTMPRNEREILKFIEEKHIPSWFFKGMISKKTRRVLNKGVNTPSSSSLNRIEKISKDTYRVSRNGLKFYAKGNIEALNYPSISIAGTRKPSKETISFVKKIVKENVDEYVIVSGLAKGCDTIAHKTTLKENGLTIAVLPCGFNNITPKGNTKLAQDIIDNDGLLISEYLPDEKANKGRYVQRNRIIAALSNTVVICEGGKGTAHTKRFAKEQGKKILVQPPIKKEVPVKKEKELKGARVKKDWNKYLKDFDLNYKCSIPKEKLERYKKVGDTQRKNMKLNCSRPWESCEDGEVTFLSYWSAKRNLAIEYNIEGIKLLYTFDSTCGRGMYIDIGNVHALRERIPLSQIFTYRPLY